MDEVITSDDILGKEAMDPAGGILGVVIKLHLHRHQKHLVGITIDQGFMRPDLFVGMEYVKYFGVNVVMLNTQPADTFKGKWVLSEHGEYRGVVKDVSFNEQGKPKGLFVARGHLSTSKKATEISLEQVKEIGNSVILKKEEDLG